MSLFSQRAVELRDTFHKNGGFKTIRTIASALPVYGVLNRHLTDAQAMMRAFQKSVHFPIGTVEMMHTATNPAQRSFMSQSLFMDPAIDHGPDAFAPSFTGTFIAPDSVTLLNRRMPVLFSNVDYLQDRHLSQTGDVIRFGDDAFDRTISFGLSLSRVLPKKWSEKQPERGYEPVALPFSDGLFLGTAHPVGAQEFAYGDNSFIARLNRTGRQKQLIRQAPPVPHEVPGAAIVIRNFVAPGHMTQDEEALFREMRPLSQGGGRAAEGAEGVQFFDYAYGRHLPLLRRLVPAIVENATKKIPQAQVNAHLKTYDAALNAREEALGELVAGVNWALFGEGARPSIDRHPVHYRGFRVGGAMNPVTPPSSQPIVHPSDVAASMMAP